MENVLNSLLKEFTTEPNNNIIILREMCETIFEQESFKLNDSDEKQLKIKNFWKYLQSFPTMLLSLRVNRIDEDEILFLSLEMEGVEDFVISLYEMKEGKEIKARRIRTLTTFNDNNPKRIISKYVNYYKTYIK